MLILSKSHFFRLFIILTVSALTGCDQCTDCELNVPEKRVNFMFINADSLEALDQLQDAGETKFDSLTILTDSIELILQAGADSVSALNIGVDSGNTDLIPLRDQLILSMQQDSSTLEILEFETEWLDSTLNVYDEVSADIVAGSVRLEEINLLEGGSVVFEDSSEVFTVALNINDTSSHYEFTIASEVYEFELSHENALDVDARRNVFVEIESFTIVRHGFDSVAPAECLTTKCPVNGTVLVCYF